MLDNTIDNVVQAIFATCDPDKSNKVLVADVVKCISPYLQERGSELLELQDALQENSDKSGSISRSLFIETMTLWTAKYKDCTEHLEDSFDGILLDQKTDLNEESFVHSTPRTSLGVLNRDLPLIQEHINLNVSTTSCPDLNRTILEDRIKDLQYANWRLTESSRRQKAQEQFFEDQIDILKRDLDLMTNKYTLTQKLIESYNKIEASKDDSTDTFEENSQVELETKYKSLQKDYDFINVEFTKQIDELEYEKRQVEKTNRDLETKLSALQTNVIAMEGEIIDKNNIIDNQKSANEALVATNNDLSMSVNELNTIVEAFKSQQKKMETSLRKSLCYNDKLQTSFNTLQAVKAIGEYSKCKHVESSPKPLAIEELPRKAEVPFSPPFKNSRFSFYNINSPKIRKSPEKNERNNSSMKDDDAKAQEDMNQDVKLEKNKDMLDISSPPVMYVVYKTPPVPPNPNKTNNIIENADSSCDEEARFSNIEPRSPHMSIQAEMQEALSCCCEETKQECQQQISSLDDEIKRQTVEKQELRQEIIERSKLIQLLENDKSRQVTTLRNLEIEIQSLKQRLSKETNIFSSNFLHGNQGRQKDTFDKLKMKLEKYENLLELKQDELRNVKMSCDVLKKRLLENDRLISDLYDNNASITKLIKTMNEDLQSEVNNFLEICRDNIQQMPTVMQLLQTVIEESEATENDNISNDPSTELLDFSKRITSITDTLRTLADSKVEFMEMFAVFQSNSNGPAVVNIQAPRFLCDSPDSPSLNDVTYFNREYPQNSTILAEADTKDSLKYIHINENISDEDNKNLITACSKNVITTKEISTQTLPNRTKRNNSVALSSFGLLLTIIYFLYESTVHLKKNGMV